jgi:hypothetical protein
VYASLAEECGQFLGWTNRNGNVFHRFKEAGRYVLVAVKKGFTPGFAIITVKPLKALAIKAPSIAGVGQLVTITVVEKYLGIPIPRAGVWAIDVNDVKEEPDDAQECMPLWLRSVVNSWVGRIGMAMCFTASKKRDATYLWQLKVTSFLASPK